MSEKRPLADEIRPLTLDEVVGQKHLLGKGALLRRGGEGEDHQQYKQQTQKTLALHFSRLLAYFILIL